MCIRDRNKSYPMNNQIISNLQEIVNLLPNLSGEKTVRSFSVLTNEMMQTIYVASIIRTITALHKLINNRIDNKERELAIEKREHDKILAAQKKEKAKEEKSEDDKSEAMKDIDKK
eukprot:TRINITY_DN7816_c0_g1_i5.p2 TRINITY_DN7816_c0_g1~~TRINITY_DN7816_c0_g1_i5.p2  ORF type:complete len:116 (+),score=60.11 TRINITY_DN7816_c0_g1_i5:73-420(+)